jgi:Family of unknown function (DUF5330)
MSLIKSAFWLGLVVLLLPTDQQQQARLMTTASSALERATTFCDRNLSTCAMGAQVWATFVKKAEFGAQMALDLINKRGEKHDAETHQAGSTALPGPMPVKVQTQTIAPQRGTLKPGDLQPAWRGQTASARAGG